MTNPDSKWGLMPVLSRGLLGPFSDLGWSGVQPAGQSGAELWPREGQGVPGRGGAPAATGCGAEGPTPLAPGRAASGPLQQRL